ncbi:hypothetical protein [Glycomyces tarimensis]
MRKNRLPRLVLAATFLGAVSALSFLPHDDDSDQVDWSYVDETNPVFPPETGAPDYDGDGTPDADDGDSGGNGNGNGNGNGDGDGNGDDGDGSTGTSPDGGGDAGEPGVRDPDANGGSGGGLLGLSLPVQAAMSLGLLALAFLALLPGRRMPASLR